MAKMTGAVADPNGINATFDDGTSTFIKAIPGNVAPAQNNNFQLLKNASTGRYAQIGKDQFASMGQGLSDYAGYVPVGYSEWLPGVSNTPIISEGTDEIRDEVNANDNSLSAGINEASGGVDSISATLSDLAKIREDINTTTDEELNAIDEAGRDAGSQYDSLIQDAVTARKSTLASEVVRAGQMGGFENTQLAGTAAVVPTTPYRSTESFVGAGGKLDMTRQLLDRNVSTLRDAQQRAVNAAKAAKAEYIRTGKRENYKDAVDAVKLANDLKKDAEAMMINRENLGVTKQRFNLDVSKQAQSAYEFERTEARMDARLNFDIDAFNIGEERLNRTADLAETKFTYEVSQDMEKKTLDNITKMASSMVDISSLSDEQITQLEHEAGLISGTFEAVYSQLQEDAQRGVTLKDLDIEAKKANIARTYQLIKKTSASGTSSGMSKAEKEQVAEKNKFYESVKDGQAALKAGNSWGQVWSTLYSQYAGDDQASNDALAKNLDQMLEKDTWSQPGAYQGFKASTQSSTPQFYVPGQ